ncbi:dynobactin maturation radical SAM/SPASM protein DynA [Cupriavidus sp. DF5525]|uniref:dynobactin maturation radical SAM/SPASM protein DynA n=1 Tax=Cupriavidus sp. DF5525 TaxID=3160989 RepID=UPI0032DED006
MNFTNVIKPTHLCNLGCKYCYNDDVRDPIMRDEVLHRTIEQTFAYVRQFEQDRIVSFVWHGGEPMLAKRAFYERAVLYQSRYADGVRCENSIQTNGTLINDNWLEFFRLANFSVSISIDGPPELHDANRVDHRGRGTYQRVIESIRRVQDSGIPFGVCVVISRSNKDHVGEIYELLAKHGLPFNIIPLNRSGSARDNFSDVGLAADEYAQSWIEMYDRWFNASEEYVYCSDFVYKTRAILSGRPCDCVGLEQCSPSNISVDPVGDVYPCASLSGHADTRYGNILQQTLEALMQSPTARDYRQRRVDPQCSTCKWQHVCHGGCQARAYKFFHDHHKRDYYCPSLFRIYEHIASRLGENFGVPTYGEQPVPAFPETSDPVAPLQQAQPIRFFKGKGGGVRHGY